MGIYWLRRRQANCSGPSGRHSDEALLAYMRAIHAEVKGEYGWPRMHKELVAVKSSNSGTSNFRDLHREERLTLVVDVTALLPKFR